MHADLSNQIQAVYHNLNCLIGVLVPDLERELRQQAQQELRLLEVPVGIAEQFTLALAEHTEYTMDVGFSLEELADAFMVNYNKSTIHFRSGMLVNQRRPPAQSFLNLLKCVWLLRKIERHQAVENPLPASHWPSYVHQLKSVSNLHDNSSEVEWFFLSILNPNLGVVRGMRSVRSRTYPARY
jgi:hypothetical protein